MVTSWQRAESNRFPKKGSEVLGIIILEPVTRKSFGFPNSLLINRHVTSRFVNWFQVFLGPWFVPDQSSLLDYEGEVVVFSPSWLCYDIGEACFVDE